MTPSSAHDTLTCAQDVCGLRHGHGGLQSKFCHTRGETFVLRKLSKEALCVYGDGGRLIGNQLGIQRINDENDHRKYECPAVQPDGASHTCKIEEAIDQ